MLFAVWCYVFVSYGVSCWLMLIGFWCMLLVCVVRCVLFVGCCLQCVVVVCSCVCCGLLFV